MTKTHKTSEDFITEAILSVSNFKGDYTQIVKILAEKLASAEKELDAIKSKKKSDDNSKLNKKSLRKFPSE